MKILIKNCNLISMSKNREKYEPNMDILIEDNKIKSIDRNINDVCRKGNRCKWKGCNAWFN